MLVKRNHYRIIFIALVGVCLNIALSGQKSLRGTTLPFDPSVTLVIAVEGKFSKFFPQEWRRLVLHPTVTAYLPDEPYQELETELPPEIWIERCVQVFSGEQLPEGWSFFFPEQGQPLRLHVVVYDEQNRLFKAVIKTWDGTVLGELFASSSGSEIVGSLDYDPNYDLLVLEIWQGGGVINLMSRNVIRTPKAETGVALKDVVKFTPEPENPFDISNPLLGLPGAMTYSHNESFPDNDTKEVAFRRPSGIWGFLKVKHYLTTISYPNNLPPDKEVAKQINDWKDEFIISHDSPTNRANFALADALVPPFSRNVMATWRDITVHGYNLGIVVIPTYAKDRIVWIPQIGFNLTGTTRGRLSILWAAQINATLTMEKKKELQIGDALPIADLYALETPRVHAQVQAQAITQQVTISVTPDQVCGPLSGGVQIGREGVQPDVGLYRECLTHGVNVPPTGHCDVNDGRDHKYENRQLSPPSYPSGPSNAPLNPQGSVTVDLPKGSRYKFKPGLSYTVPPCKYEIVPPEEKVCDVPPETQVTFSARLINVATLKVYIYPPQNTAGVYVEVLKDDKVVRSGPAQYDQNTGAYLATFGNLSLDLQPDGSYRGNFTIRAKCQRPYQQPEIYSTSRFLEPGCEVVISLPEAG